MELLFISRLLYNRDDDNYHCVYHALFRSHPTLIDNVCDLKLIFKAIFLNVIMTISFRSLTTNVLSSVDFSLSEQSI